MGLPESIRALNSLKRQRVIRDYVLIGAVAATAYMEPIFTEDLDIIVLADTDEEYVETFQGVSEAAEDHQGMHVVLGDVPVQMFPTATKPLYKDALDKAQKARVGNLRVKVASPEHLALLYLEAWRAKDRFRVQELMSSIDKRKLHSLLKKFDEKGTLATRLKDVH